MVTKRAPVRRADWEIVPAAVKGSVFLLALVTCASLMPVEKLPAAAWQTAFGLGFLSAVFDNIPLTELALKQQNLDFLRLAWTNFEETDSELRGELRARLLVELQRSDVTIERDFLE